MKHWNSSSQVNVKRNIGEFINNGGKYQKHQKMQKQNFIPLSRPDIDERFIELVINVLKTPYLKIEPKLVEFEKKIDDYVGRKFAVGVNSGTSVLSTLHKELLLLGISLIKKELQLNGFYFSRS